VIATVVLVIPIVVALAVPAIPDGVGAWLVRRFELPEFESTLGFRCGHITLPAASGYDHPVFAITEVVTGSPFDRAGVHPGDIIWRGGEHSFLWGLVWGRREGSMKLYLISQEDASHGDWRTPREVTVTFAPRPGRPPA